MNNPPEKTTPPDETKHVREWTPEEEARLEAERKKFRLKIEMDKVKDEANETNEDNIYFKPDDCDGDPTG